MGWREFDVAVLNDKRTEKYVYEVQNFSGAVEFTMESNNEKRSIGVVFAEDQEFSKARADNKNVGIVRVAVDFGSSSTVVFAQIDNNQPEELVIKEDTSQWLTGSNEAARRLIQKQFVQPVPKELEDTLYTLYYSNSSGGAQLAPVEDGIVFWLPKGAPDSEYENRKIISDLKWGNRKEAYFSAYIKQICMHAINLLQQRGIDMRNAKIDWLYAIPGSMPTDRRAYYKQDWKEIGIYLNDRTNTNNVIHSPYTEARAASQYFVTDAQVNINKGFLVVDIGGGSIDSAFWQKKEGVTAMLNQYSVEVAGRDLFTKLLLQYTTELRAIFPNIGSSTERAWLDKIEECVRDNETDLAVALMERFANRNEDALKRNMITGGSLRVLRDQIGFGIAMLYFAMGMEAGKLYSEGIIDNSTGDGAFTIAFGGNGAKILDWAYNKENEEEEKYINIFLEGMKITAPSITIKVNIRRSQAEKKVEVAIGLLKIADDSASQQDKMNHDDNTEDKPLSLSYDHTPEKIRKYCSKFEECYYSEFSVIIGAIDPERLNNILAQAGRDEDYCTLFLKRLYRGYYSEIVKSWKDRI